VNGNEFWFTSHDNAFQVVRLDRGGGGCTSVGASDAALLLLGLAGLVRWRKPAKHS
jgi:MYXO-CTERM domain-containing protein